MSISQANRAWKAEGAKRREKQEQSRNIPSRFQGGASRDYYTILIVSGNTLETGQTGIVYVSSVASVPSAYNPNVTSTFIDGIGRGTLFKNGVAQPGYVLVVNSDVGSVRNAILMNTVAWSGGAVAIPVDGGGEVSAYRIG